MCRPHRRTEVRVRFGSPQPMTGTRPGRKKQPHDQHGQKARSDNLDIKEGRPNQKFRPAASLQNVFCLDRVFSALIVRPNLYFRMSFTTTPWTSVRRKSRPL